MTNSETPSNQIDEEAIDLFDYVSELPQAVQDTLARYSAERDDEDPAVTIENLLNEIEALGYTFDYDLGYTPFGLQKMADDCEAGAAKSDSNPTLVMATFDTPNFDFQVFGRDIAHCDHLLAAAWKMHAKQTGADPAYLEECRDGVWYCEIEAGVALRDGEALQLVNKD